LCKNPIEPAGLSQLTQLRSLSWKGFISIGGGDILYRTLAANSDHLEFLELDAHDPIDHEIHLRNYAGNPKNPNAGFTLTHLQHLSLSHISLRSNWGWIRMTSAFNLDNLQVLKLRNCDSVLEFLHNLVRFGHNLKLRSFELVYRQNQSHEDALLPFLLSLHGLEAYITEVPIDDISRKHITLVLLLSHKSSVKRLICDEPVRAPFV
jgi:hypothetical protein